MSEQLKIYIAGRGMSCGWPFRVLNWRNT